MPDIQKLMDENGKRGKGRGGGTGSSRQEKGSRQTRRSDCFAGLDTEAFAIHSGRASREKIVDGKEQIVVTGTSPLTPVALAAEWDKFKDSKFSHESTSSNINGSVTEIVGYSNTENPVDAVRMEAARKAGAKVTTVTITSPGR